MMGLFGLDIFLHLSQFFLGGVALFSTVGNPFIVVSRMVAFTAVPGVPAWVSVVLFTVGSLPLLLIAANFIFDMFGSEIGAAIAVAVGVAAGVFGFVFS
jgi:hypothetical protein